MVEETKKVKEKGIPGINLLAYRYNGDVDKYLKEFEQVANIITQLELKQRYSSNTIMYAPLYKPSQAILPLTFNVNKDEIKSKCTVLIL